MKSSKPLIISFQTELAREPLQTTAFVIIHIRRMILEWFYLQTAIECVLIAERWARIVCIVNVQTQSPDKSSQISASLSKTRQSLHNSRQTQFLLRLESAECSCLPMFAQKKSTQFWQMVSCRATWHWIQAHSQILLWKKEVKIR